MSPFDLSGIEGEEAWTGGGMLPVGRHTCRITETKEGTSSGNHPEMELTLEAINGVGKITDWQVVTPGSLGKVKQILMAAGVWTDGKDWSSFSASELDGRVVDIVVAEKPSRNDPSKMHREVVAYDAPSGEAGPPADTNGLGGMSAASPEDDRIPF
jgi:hypothetical protein